MYDSGLSVVRRFCKERFNNIVLKDVQLSAVNSLSEGNYVLAILPTGFGKSVIFRVFVEAKTLLLQHEVSVLVVSQLVIIVQDQISEARSWDISSSTLKQLTLEFPEKLIFDSAEEVASTNFNFQEVLKNHELPLHQKVELIVVDESHTVETWTGR